MNECIYEHFCWDKISIACLGLYVFSNLTYGPMNPQVFDFSAWGIILSLRMISRHVPLQAVKLCVLIYRRSLLFYTSFTQTLPRMLPCDTPTCMDYRDKYALWYIVNEEVFVFEIRSENSIVIIWKQLFKLK